VFVQLSKEILALYTTSTHMEQYTTNRQVTFFGATQIPSELCLFKNISTSTSYAWNWLKKYWKQFGH